MSEDAGKTAALPDVQPWWRRFFSGALWRHHDFLKLWAGQTVSVFGSAITGLALPLTAVITLQATPAQMGLLAAAGTAPFLLLGLFAGVWADRLRRRPILLIADLGRGLLLSTIPVAALLGALHMEQLYVVAFFTSSLTAFFEVAYLAYLPTLVGRDHLIEGNSKLQVSSSITQLAGPGLAGGLVQLITAPLAILLDALSFGLSALCLALIRQAEPVPALTERRRIWHEIGDGLRLVRRTPDLWAIAGYAGSINFFGDLFFAVFVLYAIEDLDLAPAILGAALGIGSIGFLLGAALVSPLVARAGLGWTAIAGALLMGAALLGLAFLGGSPAVVAALLVAGRFVLGLGAALYNINMQSYRQAITPEGWEGRTSGTMRFITWGTLPLGGLLGGLLGERIGLRPTLIVGGVGALLACLWLILTPIRGLRAQPSRGQSLPAGD